jgi:hypothetical protein
MTTAGHRGPLSTATGELTLVGGLVHRSLMKTYGKEQGVGVLLTIVGIGWHGDKIELVMRSKGGGGKGLEGDTIQVWRR